MDNSYRIKQQYIHIKGWEEGIKTIALAKLIYATTTLNFAESKKVVDDILDGIERKILLKDGEDAFKFISSVKELGVQTAELGENSL
jgi:hypothetical protein